MSTQNDGGPAFPIVETFGPSGSSGRIENGYGGVRSVGGMSLRDWFAGQALNGMLSDPNLSAEPGDFADYAYRHADAMLKARGR